MATKKAASVTTGTPRTSTPNRSPARAPARRRQPRRSPQIWRGTDPDAQGKRTRMYVGCDLEASAPLRRVLESQIIGQNEAVDALVCSWARLLSGLRDPKRPLMTGLLLGPTGVGKTETARALAQALFGSPDTLLRINCEEYAHGHEVAKLLGSPPGYVGADIEPLLSQHRIDRPHFRLRQEQDKAEDPEHLLIDDVHGQDDGFCSILLFDEVEKAHPSVWNALLGILEEGQVTLGNNQTTDLTRSIILMTSNVGSREMSNAVGAIPLGFAPAESVSAREASLRDIAEGAARQSFPVEFLNRFDEILVYRSLDAEHLGAIFDKFLAAINERALEQAGVPLLIKASDRAKAYVIEEGTDASLGARPLRRALERLVVDPISRLLASGQVDAGDVIEIELDNEDLAFFRLARTADAIVA